MAASKAHQNCLRMMRADPARVAPVLRPVPLPASPAVCEARESSGARAVTPSGVAGVSVAVITADPCQSEANTCRSGDQTCDDSSADLRQSEANTCNPVGRS